MHELEILAESGVSYGGYSCIKSVLLNIRCCCSSSAALQVSVFQVSNSSVSSGCFFNKTNQNKTTTKNCYIFIYSYVTHSLNKISERYQYTSVMGTQQKLQSLLLCILRGKNEIYKRVKETEDSSSSEAEITQTE